MLDAFPLMNLAKLNKLEPLAQEVFKIRLAQHWPDVVRPLKLLYGSRPDFEQWLQKLLDSVVDGYVSRPGYLRRLDLERIHQPDWFQQPNMIGYVAYTDRFAGTLKGVLDKIDYLKELGVTYLHLMPLLESRPGANDGGYAVQNYRAVNPNLGSMDDLVCLANTLREQGISLCIDLVCNHTAKEHKWAKKARSGDTTYQDYYLMFDDRTRPDEYEKTLREIFPDFAPGNFTYYEDMKKWVWTTFNEYQWDLNYQNPAVFAEMLETILYLANQGISVLRLDAVAFMWKRLGTDSENQPEAHAILQAWRALTRIAAPGLLLLAEAIVSPEQLVGYLGRELAANKECELAYHNVFMVLMWSMLAERKAVLATHVLQKIPSIPTGASWLTYARCHDDIGWAITEEDADGVGLNGFAHRAFLSDFYSGQFNGSFARGEVFQFNPGTGDRRISGSLASLAGLEAALEQKNSPWQIELAVRRILLLHNLIFAFGGLPLLYMGDEIGLLNDDSYLSDPNLAEDNRWLHRPYMDWDKASLRHDPNTITSRLFNGLRQLIQWRKGTPALHSQVISKAIWVGNEHVFGLVREGGPGRVLILANLTEHNQTVSPQPTFPNAPQNLAPYQVCWVS